MSIIALAAAAVALTAPSWKAAPITFEDYSTSEVAEGKSAGAVITLLVGVDGKIQRCDLLSYRGDAELAQKACTLLKRKRMNPARDASGAPAMGVYPDFVRFFLPKTKAGDAIASLRLEPDLRLEVTQLPPGAGSTLELELAVSVAANGVVEQCSKAKDGPEDYLKVACMQATGKQLSMVNDLAGVPISTVRKIRVNFVMVPG